LIFSSRDTIAAEFTAVNFQRCLRVNIQGFISAYFLHCHDKPARPRIQIVADAGEHRDEQQRENKESGLVIAPQGRDKAISFSKRRAATWTKVRIVSDASATFRTDHTTNL
jgi:hypothetical protein